MRSTRRYGWKPDLPDHRDHLLAIHPRRLLTLPDAVDLRPQCPAVYDQGDIGSCTGNATAGAIEFDRLAQGLADFTPSRLFLYYNGRALEGDTSTDAGAQIRDVVSQAANLGAPPESDWPYVPAEVTVEPDPQACSNALLHKVACYQRAQQQLAQLQASLAAGKPFVFGFTVYSSFESDQVAETGIVPMPRLFESAVGGHAVLAVGYCNATQRFIVRNSWGASWGMAGYFAMPYAYVTSARLASDFWVLQTADVSPSPTPSPAPMPALPAKGRGTRKQSPTRAMFRKLKESRRARGLN
jgi:C1A family cysteine protease